MNLLSSSDVLEVYMPEIVPSLASANQTILKEELMKVSSKFCTCIHLDIEDGNFVPNITFGLKTIKQLRQISEQKFNVHLMVSNPERYIKELADMNNISITLHLESINYPSRYINYIKDHGIKVGIAVNPVTPIIGIEYLLKELDFILIMTAEPDGRGEVFIPESYEKIKKLYNMKTKNQEIWVDGDVRKENLLKLWESGADVFVMGREIFGSQNPYDKTEEIYNYISRFHKRNL
jgi:ribulose-phosphate 3-epimerase